ncbi:MAG: hypothetical protein IJR07_06875 [Bacteroidaceae bacterium]|nr:hypothetical protein [Bacteroidaceae bacterium]
MNYVDKMLKLQELVKRIKKGGTGTQATLSQELRTNLATLNRQFDMLRDMEADLRFDRIKNTYYFNNSFDLTVSVTKE